MHRFGASPLEQLQSLDAEEIDISSMAQDRA
jgi:hypothetical protein